MDSTPADVLAGPAYEFVFRIVFGYTDEAERVAFLEARGVTAEDLAAAEAHLGAASCDAGCPQRRGAGRCAGVSREGAV